MGFTTDLFAGVAQLLDDAGVGTWRADGRYTNGTGALLAGITEPVIVRTSVPSAPDRVITLTPYGVADDIDQADSVQGLQVRTRGTKDPRVVEDIDDAVFDALHSLSDVVIGGVFVLLIERRSTTSLGVDANGREERSSNYYLTLTRPSTHRP